MKKASFYICILEGEPKKIVAKKQVGYSEGDIGLHKGIGNIWIATHIPTGLKLTSTRTKTRASALKEARQRLAGKMYELKKSLKAYIETEAFKSFAKSRYEQSDTTVF